MDMHDGLGNMWNKAVVTATSQISDDDDDDLRETTTFPIPSGNHNYLTTAYGNITIPH
jgi:hypothetical protein